MKKIIVCLVSRQAMANVIPVLELKPDKVYLLITEEEKDVAFNLKKLFVTKKIDCVIFNDKIDAYNLTTVKNACGKIIKSEQVNYILNVTGGTKPMAIAAYETFRTNNFEVIYYDPVHHIILNLDSLSVKPKKVELKINIEDYLLSYGYSIIEEKTKTGRAEKLGDFVKGFNKNRINEFINFMNISRKIVDLSRANEGFSKNDFQFSKNYDKITVLNKKTKNKYEINIRDYNSGNWLEDLLYLKIKNDKNDDVKYSVKIKKGNIINEIDVLSTKNCEMHLYSCKTGKRNNSDIFEVDVLRNLTGGTFGKANFVILDDVTEQLHDRANQLNIKIINFRNL